MNRPLITATVSATEDKFVTRIEVDMGLHPAIRLVAAAHLIQDLLARLGPDVLGPEADTREWTLES